MATVRRNARGEVTEREILSATFRHLERCGYDRTTIGSIVRATGKPASSIYHMFGSKDGLVARALEYSYPETTLAQAWTPFDAERSMEDQLTELMLTVLRKDLREESVRVGIMMALEGAAAVLGIQEPFRTRRDNAIAEFMRWWGAAYSAGAIRLPDGADVELAAARMAYLVTWFMDGHFVGDRDATGAEAPVRAVLLARTLVAVAASDFAAAPAPALRPEDLGGGGPVDDDPLLQATRELIAEYSYDGATIARICEASGLKRSSVYWRFADKDALVNGAVSDQFLGKMGWLFELPTIGPDSGPEDVARVLGAELVDLQSRTEDDPALMKAGMLMAVQRWDPPTTSGEALKYGSREIAGRLSGWLQSWPGLDLGGLHAREISWLFSRLRMGIIVSHILGDEAPLFDQDMAQAAIAAVIAARV